MKQVFNTFIERWKAPCEQWFKGVLKVGLWCFGLSTALLAAPSVYAGFELPEVLKPVCQWMAVAGVVMSFIAKTSSTEHK